MESYYLESVLTGKPDYLNPLKVLISTPFLLNDVHLTFTAPAYTIVSPTSVWQFLCLKRSPTAGGPVSWPPRGFLQPVCP